MQAERIRRRDPQAVAASLFERCLGEAGLKGSDLGYVATTGEGEMVPFRTGHFYGMTTHARGGLFLVPEARAVIDIGALHTRAVLIDPRATGEAYRMTSQCASGSGQFLENISRYLGITIDEIGPLSLQADDPEACSSICAVLAETDVINMVSRGIRAANILKKEEFEPIALSYTPEPAEDALITALDAARPRAADAVAAEDFAGAMAALATLRAPIDAFFDKVTVNDADPAKRAARLTLLARFRDAVHAVADFSKIEG